MPVIFVALAGIAAFIGAATVVALWSQILGWTRETLIPWLEQKWPALAKLAEKALIMADRVAAPLLRAAKQAWAQLRERLLKVLVTLRESTGNVWIKTTVTWLLVNLEAGKKEEVWKRTEESKVNWESLPDDIRRAALERRQKRCETDLTKEQDAALAPKPRVEALLEMAQS